MVFLGLYSSFFLQKLYFCLNRSHDLLPFLLWIIQMVIGLDMRWLEQGRENKVDGTHPGGN
jgi:hypothetical protein